MGTCYDLIDGTLLTILPGGTNIVEIAPNKGLVYYLKNDRKGGGGKILGAGVAEVHMEGDVPHARRVHDTLWGPKDPHYGDVGICLDPRDGHLYVFGHGPSGDKELESRTFMCRVPKDHAMDIHKYEYWDNGERKWRPRRHTIDGSNGTGQLTQVRVQFYSFKSCNHANIDAENGYVPRILLVGQHICRLYNLRYA